MYFSVTETSFFRELQRLLNINLQHSTARYLVLCPVHGKWLVDRKPSTKRVLAHLFDHWFKCLCAGVRTGLGTMHSSVNNRPLAAEIDKRYLIRPKNGNLFESANARIQ